jgi:misacylated tRNA(Ala) deacylase
MKETILNNHNKQEFPPMHSAEHILNQTMVRMFNCDRSRNNHIEKKKSKCDYILKEAPTTEQIYEIENRVNEIISKNLPITNAFVLRKKIPISVDLSRLPEDARKSVRLVYIGDYDLCACIGLHVTNTSEIGKFRIVSTNYSAGTFRIRFKLD